jgi:hypothetical protein
MKFFAFASIAFAATPVSKWLLKTQADTHLTSAWYPCSALDMPRISADVKNGIYMVGPYNNDASFLWAALDAENMVKVRCGDVAYALRMLGNNPKRAVEDLVKESMALRLKNRSQWRKASKLKPDLIALTNADRLGRMDFLKYAPFPLARDTIRKRMSALVHSPASSGCHMLRIPGFESSITTFKRQHLYGVEINWAGVRIVLPNLVDGYKVTCEYVVKALAKVDWRKDLPADVVAVRKAIVGSETHPNVKNPALVREPEGPHGFHHTEGFGFDCGQVGSAVYWTDHLDAKLDTTTDFKDVDPLCHILKAKRDVLKRLF